MFLTRNKNVATRLDCSIGQLELTVVAVDHQLMDKTLMAVVMFPESAAMCPMSALNPRSKKVQVSYTIAAKLILPPITNISGWNANTSPTREHSLGKKSWYVSETITK